MDDYGRLRIIATTHLVKILVVYTKLEKSVNIRRGYKNNKTSFAQGNNVSPLGYSNMVQAEHPNCVHSFIAYAIQ